MGVWKDFIKSFSVGAVLFAIIISGILILGNIENFV